jgi:hypothetical protein
MNARSGEVRRVYRSGVVDGELVAKREDLDVLVHVAHWQKPYKGEHVRQRQRGQSQQQDCSPWCTRYADLQQDPKPQANAHGWHFRDPQVGEGVTRFAVGDKVFGVVAKPYRTSGVKASTATPAAAPTKGPAITATQSLVVSKGSASANHALSDSGEVGPRIWPGFRRRRPR